MTRSTDTIHAPVAIIGAGIAGLTAGTIIKQSGLSYCIYERTGGLAGVSHSFKVGNFTFDYGIHGLYTQNNDITTKLARAVERRHIARDISIADYFRGTWARHPIYANLRALPMIEAKRYLYDLLDR